MMFRFPPWLGPAARLLALTAVMVGTPAAVMVAAPAAGQQGASIKDRWMTACSASGGGGTAYCDCTFEAIGSRLSIDDMATMIAIVEAAMTGDPEQFGAMVAREGLDREAVAAWDQRMQSLSALADRQCAAFAPGG